MKFRGKISYIADKSLGDSISVGSWVKVDLTGRVYPAIVREVTSSPDSSNPDILYKEILEVMDEEPVSPLMIKFWQMMADYYLCTVGELFKAAYPSMVVRQGSVRSREVPADFFKKIAQESISEPVLSEAQGRAIGRIRHFFKDDMVPVLLQGVTGSGKTEIYVSLAADYLKRGKSVLFMVPEIALTKQLQERLKGFFGERLLVYHSKRTVAQKGRIHRILSGHYAKESGVGSPDEAMVVLGTRSALFLPFRNLGLIVVDEEHDSSYKQSEPAPRYQARDSAIMLSSLYGANILLGSATPSLESEYNCSIGRFRKVLLTERYFGYSPVDITIIDTIWARKSGQMRGNFSQQLINAIGSNLEKGGQVLVFRNRRSYSPIVECSECGTIAKCPECNVYLSYHKYNNTLRCHYCDYSKEANRWCSECGNESMVYKGAGTERIEDELREIFPQYRIERFDADIAASKREEERVLGAFASGEVDILVGTQMLSKGFDFKNLNMVVVLQADTIWGIQDFRADERALQLLSQLTGRTGRRGQKSAILIQTNQKEYPVLKQLGNILQSGVPAIAPLLRERCDFSFVPYVRMVKISVKHKNPEKLNVIVEEVGKLLGAIGAKEVTGPFIPPVDRVRGEWIRSFYVKFARDSRLAGLKNRLIAGIEQLKVGNGVIVDVDP